MASAAWALQTALYQRLVADTALAALIGGARIYDDVPRDATFPYVTFGPVTVRDFSTGTETHHEHAVALHVWSRAAGRKETHEILGAVQDAVHEAGLTLAGHRLVNLRFETSETRRDPDGETTQGVIRFRAVTEPV